MAARHLIGLVVAAASLVVSPVTCAVLGGLPNVDRGEISVKRATRLVAPRPGYEGHQVTLDSGTRVKEFVGPSGYGLWRGVAGSIHAGLDCCSASTSHDWWPQNGNLMVTIGCFW